MRRLLFQTPHDAALMPGRARGQPQAIVPDSQTVKALHVLDGGGCDAAKRTKGRKRHVAMGADGRLLMVDLATADVQDAAGAEQIIAAVRKRWPCQLR